MKRPQKIDSRIIGHKQQLGKYSLDSKGFILYALGIGFSTGMYLHKLDPMKTDDFKYTYELDERFSSIYLNRQPFQQQPLALVRASL